MRLQTFLGHNLRARCHHRDHECNEQHCIYTPLLPIKQEGADVKHAGGGIQSFFIVKEDPGPVMTLTRSTDSALIGSFTYHRGEHQSLLAGFSLEPDALDKMLRNGNQSSTTTFPICRPSAPSDIPGAPILYLKAAGAAIALTRRLTLQKLSPEAFIASGDHGDGWRGFMEGAIASGSQTAMAVLKCLSDV